MHAPGRARGRAGDCFTPIAYCFRETDFRADTLSDLNGIFVTSVPEADVATVCLGERVIRAGDVLPVSVLGELELLPVSTGGQEAALCYCPIRGTALGEPAQVTIRIRSARMPRRRPTTRNWRRTKTFRTTVSSPAPTRRTQT